ncbi:MAG TPA: hypothetical protein VN605_11555 [Thermoanaerobaculia bacterium]|nr:hypothetical protein [Thermoanaerobaculia bacterium]
MRTNERQLLHAEGNKRFLRMLQRMSQVRELAPWLRPGQSHSALRWTVARLRSGAIPSLDSRIPAAALAAALEASIAQDQLVRSIAMEMNEYQQMWDALSEQEQADRIRAFVAGFHQLKKSPEARDPESPAAEDVRRIHRTRRREHGRPRKRKKKG